MLKILIWNLRGLVGSGSKIIFPDLATVLDETGFDLF
jgi:hypothetical protein